MPISALPTPPSRSNPSAFANEADAFLSALPTFATEANSLATDVNNSQIAAADSEDAALTYANNAQASANAAQASAVSASNASSAPKWVSGTNYTEGQCTWSPTSFLTYRAKSNITGSVVDPALTTAWELLNGEIAKETTSSLAFTALHNWHYILTGAGDVNVTLPTPSNYMKVRITVANNRDTNNVLRGTATIMGIPENCRLDNKNATATFEYLNNTWRIT
jgi:hypothetical protein